MNFGSVLRISNDKALLWIAQLVLLHHLQKIIRDRHRPFLFIFDTKLRADVEWIVSVFVVNEISQIEDEQVIGIG